jgi:hypothetical protein
MRTSITSAPSAKAIVRPSRRHARASATSSARLSRAGAHPPFATSASRRAAMHWPLNTARLGRGWLPSSGPKR